MRLSKYFKKRIALAILVIAMFLTVFNWTTIGWDRTLFVCGLMFAVIICIVELE